MNHGYVKSVAIRLFLILYVAGCSVEPPANTYPPLFKKVEPGESGLDFENTLIENDALNILTYEYFYNGAGIGIGDFNRDSLPDVFFSSNQGNSQLYVNKGGLTFEKVTDMAGIQTLGKWGTGVSVVDINSDGWLDIYVCVSGPYSPENRGNFFFINQKDGSFEDQAKELGLDDSGPSIQAAFFDFDRDGDLDVYILNNTTFGLGPNVIRPKQVEGQAPSTDKLFENVNGRFVDISRQAGILKEGYGLGLSIRDINGDDWPDIYVSNDYLSNDLLYINQGDGTFKDLLSDYIKHSSYSAMGNDIADINNDGWEDMIALDMAAPNHRRRKLMFSSINYDRHRSELLSGYTPQYMRNTLQLNQGIPPGASHPVFAEIGQLSGINATDWSWAPLFIDLDNDGHKDLVVSNGYPRDITNLDFVAYKMSKITQQSYTAQTQSNLVSAIQGIEGSFVPNQVFHNDGNLRFQDKSYEWGFVDSSYSHATAYADLDLDGDLDLVFSNTNEAAFLYENLSTGNNFLQIVLQGPFHNLNGIGAKVAVYHQGTKQIQEFHPVRGFQSSQEPLVHFGLGSREQVDSVVVHWMDGKESFLERIAVNQRIEVSYQNSQEPKSPISSKQSSLFEEVTPSYLGKYAHQEVHFADFHVQPLLLQKYSHLGPGLSAGDINGDGKEDFFIGGAFKQSGTWFVQKDQRKWERKKLETGSAYTEDMGSLIFDVEGDGDNDLYVVSGGNEFPQGSSYYNDRLYINDGSGRFSLDTLAIPPLYTSGSCVVGEDFDRDGDLDLFVGGRLRPQSFPQPGISRVLENKGGRFEEVTDKYFPGVKEIGRVTAALWSDANQDNKKDLWVVGEWMPIELFVGGEENWRRATDEVQIMFPGDSLSRPLRETVGWWNSINGGDFDRDGDTDYILGNFGLNSMLQTSKEEPVSLYIGDFNGDERAEAILCHFLQGKEAPFHFKDDLQKQLIDIKKRFPFYEDYAAAEWKNFFPSIPADSIEVRRADVFESLYLENLGSLSFRAHPLPIEAQMAPVHGIEVEDINRDGWLDVILSGNMWEGETSSGAYDALNGLVLIGNGKGTFESLSLQESGWYIPGDGKSLVTLPYEENLMVIAAENNGPLRAFLHAPKVQAVYPKISNSIQTAWLLYTDQKWEKREIYRGSGYLSQSSRYLNITPSIQKAIGITSEGDSVHIFSRN